MTLQSVSSGYIRVKNSDLHFIRFGSGEKLLVAFHGFGYASEVFLPVAGALERAFTVYAFDLPFHGKTRWREEKMSDDEFISLAEEVCRIEGKSHFELMGYSFGARIVEAIFLKKAPQVDRLWLVAPDGIATKWVSALFRTPYFLRRTIKRALANPAWLMRALEYLHQKKRINPYIYFFFQRRMGSAQARDALFFYWLNADSLGASPAVFKEALKQTGIRAELFFGRHDPLIPVTAGEWLQQGLPNARLNIIEEGGHHLLNERMNRLFMKIV